MLRSSKFKYTSTLKEFAIYRIRNMFWDDSEAELFTAVLLYNKIIFNAINEEVTTTV